MFDYARELCMILRSNDREAYVVGGAVRDRLMGRIPHDIDIATDAIPKEVTKIFTREGYIVIPIGEKFGTVQIMSKTNDTLIEITTYRSEEGYTDRRHPDKIKFEKKLIKDLERRDFTINAIAYDPLLDEYFDPFNGMQDIKDNVLRAVGNPILRFSEDPLRMMRLCRFSAQLHMYVDMKTRKAAQELCNLIEEISGERIRDELIKILSTDKPHFGIGEMIRTGLLFHVLPEVDRLRGVKQPPHHHMYDVFYHSSGTIQHLALNGHNDKPYLLLAGLLHDIGKLKMNSESPYFPYHVADGMNMLTEIFNRLKISNENRAYVRFLVGHHMDGFNFSRKFSQRSIRRYLNKIKNPAYLEDLEKLMIADMQATGYPHDEMIAQTKNWFEEIHKVLNEKQPFSKKDLVINGHDLLAIGIPPCHMIESIQKMLVDDVIDDPSKNNREYLLERANQIHRFLMMG